MWERVDEGALARKADIFVLAWDTALDLYHVVGGSSLSGSRAHVYRLIASEMVVERSKNLGWLQMMDRRVG